MCIRDRSRTVPTNYILLSLFTLLESWTLSCYISHFDPNIIVTAALITAGVCSGLFVYSMTTTKDISIFMATAASLSGYLLLASLWGLFVGFGGFTYILYQLVGVAVYANYLIIDVKSIIGGGRFEVSIDDYVRASMRVYMDIVVLFIKIVNLLQKMSEDNNKKKNRK
eukprot:TRINITY_DN144_c0_g1_i1.p2 TRINITY_DN144_c0_g1~~TRINITY_DN144_c0_g1_i1.p2  ORF type:complete len:168 (+),score=23.28 TRINITY_DN144_c0_g1_i1:66-569(+)